MTDKVQKILSEIATRKLCTMDEHMAFYNDTAKEDYRFLSEIEKLIKALQEEPVSTKDKLLALSDGKLHLGWIDDAKVVEFEECLMQFHEDINNIPQGTDSLTRLKDTDGVLHSYSKKLMSIAKEEPVSKQNLSNVQRTVKNWKEPVSDDSEEAAKRYAIESYPNEPSIGQFGTGDYEPYVDMSGQRECAVEDFKAGAKWQKEQDQSTIELAEDHAMLAGMNIMEQQMMAKAKSGTVQKDNQVILDNGTYIDLDPSMQLKPSFVGLKEGDRIKVIVIKEADV